MHPDRAKALWPFAPAPARSARRRRGPPCEALATSRPRLAHGARNSSTRLCVPPHTGDGGGTLALMFHRRYAPRGSGQILSGRLKGLKTKAFPRDEGATWDPLGTPLSQRCDMSTAAHNRGAGVGPGKHRKAPDVAPGGPCNTRTCRRRWRSWHRLCARAGWFGRKPDLNLQLRSTEERGSEAEPL